jgi:hypothetical protein
LEAALTAQRRGEREKQRGKTLWLIQHMLNKQLPWEKKFSITYGTDSSDSDSDGSDDEQGDEFRWPDDWVDSKQFNWKTPGVSGESESAVDGDETGVEKGLGGSAAVTIGTAEDDGNDVVTAEDGDDTERES